MKALAVAALGCLLALPAGAMPQGVGESVGPVPGHLQASTAASGLGLRRPSLVLPRQVAKKPPPPGFGGWFHLGGGAGAQIGARKVHPVGRVDIGFGGYLFLVYGGIAANVSFSSHLDFVGTGVAYVGLAPPIPIVRPLIGFKAGGGAHVDREYGLSPAIHMGPQLGVHVGQILGSRFGFRIMVDPEVIVSTKHRMAGFGIVGTVALLL